MVHLTCLPNHSRGTVNIFFTAAVSDLTFLWLCLVLLISLFESPPISTTFRSDQHSYRLYFSNSGARGERPEPSNGSMASTVLLLNPSPQLKNHLEPERKIIVWKPNCVTLRL